MASVVYYIHTFCIIQKLSYRIVMKIEYLLSVGETKT